MADILIRDVPEAVLNEIDAEAQRAGLSRSEYLRRMLARSTSVTSRKVTIEDLTLFSETFGDLADPEVMRQAWQ